MPERAWGFNSPLAHHKEFNKLQRLRSEIHSASDQHVLGSAEHWGRHLTRQTLSADNLRICGKSGVNPRKGSFMGTSGHTTSQTPPDPELAAFGSRLAAARRALSWSQMDLAGAAGVNRVTVSKIERGFTDPGVLTVLKLLNALGLEANDLLITNRRQPEVP